MKAVVSVIGKDRTGIIATVATRLYKLNINIEDISQTIMQDNFVMIMLVDTKDSGVAPDSLCDELRQATENMGVVVHVEHEDLFNAMHRLP